MLVLAAQYTRVLGTTYSYPGVHQFFAVGFSFMRTAVALIGFLYFVVGRAHMCGLHWCSSVTSGDQYLSSSFISGKRTSRNVFVVAACELNVVAECEL